MLKRNTAIILGAGAGVDIGMPVGSSLAQHIIGRVKYRHVEGQRTAFGDEVLAKAFFDSGAGGGGDYRRACDVIRNGLVYANSIDEFLHTHEGNKSVQVLGKLAIACSILYYEAQSHLFIQPPATSLDIGRIRDSWLPTFFRMIHSGVGRGYEARMLENLSVINFNYDRCFEHFLFNASRDYFDLDSATAAKVMERLNIKHPYGTVGDLPWMSSAAAPIDFGVPPTAQVIIEAARKLRTYTEEIDDKDRLAAVREIISTHQTVIFLGFHFHEANIELLAPRSCSDAVYATVLGRSPDDCRIVGDSLKKFLKSGTLAAAGGTLIHGSCSDALGSYGLAWRT